MSTAGRPPYHRQRTLANHPMQMRKTNIIERTRGSSRDSEVASSGQALPLRDKPCLFVTSARLHPHHPVIATSGRHSLLRASAQTSLVHLPSHFSRPASPLERNDVDDLPSRARAASHSAHPARTETTGALSCSAALSRTAVYQLEIRCTRCADVGLALKSVYPRNGALAAPSRTEHRRCTSFPSRPQQASTRASLASM